MAVPQPFAPWPQINVRVGGQKWSSTGFATASGTRVAATFTVGPVADPGPDRVEYDREATDPSNRIINVGGIEAPSQADIPIV